MVFSLFKKPVLPTPGLGATPLAARSSKVAPAPSPAPAARQATQATTAAVRAGSAAPAESMPKRPVAARPSQKRADDELVALTATSLDDISVTIDQDPLEDEIDRVVMYFASGQDEAAIDALESLLLQPGSSDIGNNALSPGQQRLWHLLFSLYRLIDDRTRFELRALDFARLFEQSPPPWRAEECVDCSATGLAAASRRTAPGSQLIFKGELLASNHAALDGIARAIQRSPRISVDFSRLKQLDAGGALLLARLLDQARRQARIVVLHGEETLCGLCQQARATSPDAEGYWLLHLELLQREGDSARFEEDAIEYAVRFEMSPPSWEPLAGPQPAEALPETPPPPKINTFALSGDLKRERFDELGAYASTHNPVIIDLSALQRLDFVSASQLCNVLAQARRNKRHTILHHPSPLISELLRVVGLGDNAEIVQAHQPGFARN